MSTSERSLRHGPDIFVSYRRTDKEFVEKLVAVVEAFGPSVWWDAEIEAGEDWRESIVENLAASRCLVIVFSEACNESKQLKKELAVADHLDKDVIPVLIEQTRPRGFFLYELAALNWISIYPAPMEKLDSVARLLIERLEAAGWAALPVIAPSGLAPPQPPASADVAAATRPTVSGQPAVAPFAPPVSPKPTAPATTSALPRPVPLVTTAERATLTVADTQRLRLGDVFPFRWIDLVLPVAATVFVLLFGRDDGDDLAVIVGGTLLVFVLVLAMTGLIVFPLRYYRRRCNPYRVARNLVISNVVFALGGAVAGILIAKSVAEEGQSLNEVRAYTAASLVLFGLLLAAISFAIFALLSRFRARKTYQEGFERL